MSSSNQDFLNNESELNKKLKIQAEETLRTEEDLAQLIKIRDEQKRKAEKVQRLRNGYVCLHVCVSNPIQYLRDRVVMTEIVKKLVEAVSRLDEDIEHVRSQIHSTNESDPQHTARNLNTRMQEIRTQNAALCLERLAKEVVCEHLSDKRCPLEQQLQIIKPPQMVTETDLSRILTELDESDKLRRAEH